MNEVRIGNRDDAMKVIEAVINKVASAEVDLKVEEFEAPIIDCLLSLKNSIERCII